MQQPNLAETWLPIPGWEDRYEVSDSGRVRSLRRNRILRPYLTPLGYHRVTLYRPGNPKSKAFVHVLVAAAFIGPRPSGQHVRHLDGNSLNNCRQNLAYGTPGENVMDQVLHGTHVWASKTKCPEGHSYEGDNVIIQSSGSRACRTCALPRKRESERRRRARMKAEGSQ